MPSARPEGVLAPDGEVGTGEMQFGERPTYREAVLGLRPAAATAFEESHEALPCGRRSR